MEHADALSITAAPWTAEDERQLVRLIAEAKAAGHPLAEFVGTLKDDPLVEEWQQAVRDYRRQVDEQDDAAAAPSVPALDDPARRFAGIFKDNPLYDEWQEAMRDYRRQVNDAPDMW